MMMPGRKYAAENGYRYGFNGKENDNEVKGEGNVYDFGGRIQDSRLGKWFSVDPVTKTRSPYNFSANNPINYVDPDGEDEIHFYYTTTKVYRGGPIPLSNTSVSIKLIPKDGPDKFYYHDEVIKIHSTTPNSKPIVIDDVTEFFPRGKNFDGGKHFSRITTHASGWPLIGGIGQFRSSDDDFTALAKLANQELIDYLKAKDKKNYGHLGMHAAFTALAQGIEKASGLLLLLDAGPTLFAIGKEALAARTLTIEEAGIPGSHFLSRHGAQTTLDQQLIRATTGLTPDGVAGRAVASSRFLTNELQLEALNAAKTAYTPGMTQTTIEMGKTVGEGYFKGGGAVQSSTSVQVYYNSNGGVKTLFPKL